MIISVDTGNKQFKTRHFIFTSGLTQSNVPPALTSEVMQYQGMYYSLSDQRIKYTRKKFTDENFFLLTLFAIGKEILKAYPNSNPNETRSITLLLGLPLGHYGNQYHEFENFYRKRDIISFTYNGHPLKIRIDHVMTFVQGYSAIVTDPSLFQEEKLLLIDVGGFTADYVKLINGRIRVEESKTLEMGVIPLYNKIIYSVNENYDFLLNEKDIDSVILNDFDLNLDSDFLSDIKAIINEEAMNHIDKIVRQLREDGIDLRTYCTVFIGGGSLLLQKYIEQFKNKTKLIGKFRFVEDIHANCLGYEAQYRDFQKLKKKQK